MRAIAILFLPIVIAGCTANSTTAPTPPAQCVAEPALHLIGKVADAETGAEIERLTGASVFQWVPEGSAVTMDYRIERVRVTYDANMIITHIRCG